MKKSTAQDTAFFDSLLSFILVGNINSFQKLYFLLGLHERCLSGGTCQELAKQLYIGDTNLVEHIITDLNATGLLTCTGNRYKLSDDSLTTQYLHYLVIAFADPLTRQDLLDQVQSQSQLFISAKSVLERYSH